MKRNVLLALLILCSTMISVAQTGVITIKGKIDGIKK